MNPHPLEAVPLSSVTSAALVQQWEKHVTGQFPSGWSSVPHLAELLTARTLASLPFTRRVTRLSPVEREQLTTHVRHVVEHHTAYWDDVEVPGRMSIVLVRLVLFALSPDCLDIPYRALSADEQRQMAEAKRQLLPWLRKTQRGTNHGWYVQPMVLEAFLFPYRAESAHLMLLDDLEETALIVYRVLDQWRSTLLSRTPHPSRAECEQAAKLVLRVLLGQIKRDVFQLPWRIDES